MAKTRIPLAVEAMLREDRRPHTKPDLSRKPAEALQRLRWICDEIDKRICEEPDEMRFGDIDGFVDEAHNLAFELGFADPPVERIRYERGQSTGACSQCRWRLQSAAGGPFGWGLKPSTWPIYTMKPAVMRVDGYRFHDPDRGAVPAELLLVCVCDTDADGRQHLHDAWEKRPKIEERADAVKLLRRWSRFIGEQVTTPDREPHSNGALGGNVKGADWRQVQAKAETYVEAHGWPGTATLCKVCGCSWHTLNKAVKNSPALQHAKEAAEPKTSPAVVGLSDTLESVIPSQADDPAHEVAVNERANDPREELVNTILLAVRKTKPHVFNEDWLRAELDGKSQRELAELAVMADDWRDESHQDDPKKPAHRRKV